MFRTVIGPQPSLVSRRNTRVAAAANVSTKNAEESNTTPVVDP